MATCDKCGGRVPANSLIKIDDKYECLMFCTACACARIAALEYEIQQIEDQLAMGVVRR